MNILVVDSLAHVRQRIAGLLRQHGYRAITAATGPEALELVAQDSEIGVVLCDFAMPGCDGMDFLMRVKEITRENDGEEVKPPLVLLMVSPNPRNEREVMLCRSGVAAQMGFGDLFVKPPDRERLLTKLESLRSQFVPSSVSQSMEELRTGVAAVLEMGDPHVMAEVRGELEKQVHRLDVALEEIGGPAFLQRTSRQSTRKQ